MTSLGDLRWFWTQLLSVFSDLILLRYQWPVLFLALTVFGILALLRTRRATSLLLPGPLRWWQRWRNNIPSAAA